MTKPKITRRGFLKLAGASAASTAVLTGCSPASRYVVREPYANMPEYTYNGESTYYATTCLECPAGCGIVVRTVQGRAIKVEGNPLHPVNTGRTCARGQATIQGLYNPDRVQYPLRQNRESKLSKNRITWDEAIGIVTEALEGSQPDQIAFVLGNTHDHLADLIAEISSAMEGSQIFRINASNIFNGSHTVKEATSDFFEETANLSYDIQNADLILSFGANFLETWGSPVSFTRQYASFRKGKKGKRGTLVHFEPRLSQTASVADKWVPIIPGTESMVARALGRLISEAQGQLPDVYSGVDTEALAGATGISVETLSEIAQMFVESDSPLAIPGGHANAQGKGAANIRAILSLNSLAISSGKLNLVSSAPDNAIESNSGRNSSLGEFQNLIANMKTGKINTLIIHGANPAFDIPSQFRFEEAVTKVDTVISFSSFPDETALQSDYIFPDHTNLESWGYQRVSSGVQGATLSGLQPAVSPFFETQSTVDVLLSAIQQIGGELASGLPYSDEVAYLEHQLAQLVGQDNSLIRAGEAKTFISQFQQFGGWWSETDQGTALQPNLPPAEAGDQSSQLGKDEFFLHIFMSPILGDKGANKPWLQETPDPTTTVMWNTWIEINPKTAKKLGIHDDDIVQLITPNGHIEASVYLYPGIRPDTVAVPFGQGHTAYGRYAQGRGVNPFDLLPPTLNDSGDLALSPIKVKVKKTGSHKQLARLESRIGVYGFDEH